MRFIAGVPRSGLREESASYPLKVLALAGAYFAAGKLGLSFAFEVESISAVWAPTGIALAALVLGGYRYWPGVAIGALLVNATTAAPAGAVLGIAAGNTLESLAGAHLLRRLAGFRPSLERVRDVLALVLLAGVVSTMVSATLGVGSLALAGSIDVADLLESWRTWWLGDMGGVLLVAPPLLIAATERSLGRLPGRPVEAAVLVAVAVAVSLFVFSREVTLIYLIFPVLIWAALRFLQPGAAATSLIVVSIAVVLTDRGEGPFAMSGPDENLLLAQTFMSVVAVTALLLAAATSERRRIERDARDVADTLQSSLRPAQLPEVPGVELAACFLPVGEGSRVGGDFYDVFDTGDGRWAIFVGDVCGKGAAAAAVTGLARYTLRAAAAQESRPSRMLSALNDAILRQRNDEEFCTVACGRLEVNGDRSVELTVACGGHPLPLYVGVDGTVESIGEPGMLLGVEPAPELVDHTVRLRTGDALVLYTDGLTDAYAPARMLSAAELASLLESCGGLTAAGIVECLKPWAIGAPGREPRDDVAILVVRIAEPTEGPRPAVSVRLESEPQAAATAREVVDRVGDGLESAVLDTLRLLVSELVTNSVRHGKAGGDASVDLSVEVGTERVRVDVSDDGRGFDPDERLSEAPARSRDAVDLDSGWGLYLVEQLADHWGVDRGERTRVWFELERREAAAARRSRVGV